MHLWIILCCWVIVYPTVGHAETIQPYIQSLPSGEINWTDSTLTAKGNYRMPDSENVPRDVAGKTELMQHAYLRATDNLLHTLQKVRINTDHCVIDTMMANAQINDKVMQMCRSANQTKAVRRTDGTLEIWVRMDLLGSFMQLILPDDIRQVESIKPMTGTAAEPPATPEAPTGAPENSDEDGYSGLVVDARGIGAEPSMVPAIVDESGKQVYGSIFISREYAVQYGVCTYIRDVKSAHSHHRVAPNPLSVKGLRTIAGHQSDIVISNADAARMKDASANLNFLKQCRVLIILD